MGKHPVRSTYLPLPGVPEFDPDLVGKFEQARISKGEGYRPRTRHLRPDGRARYTNRLFLETSPYLLQHAHNPVNWYPWGDEAFDHANRLNRPVFVSIGYSTCHWCHVMEEESFEDEEIARCLNENYVAVKVDREERPDVDAIYMSAVQALTGGGGWPLNVWLLPDRQPFFGGTYFPPRDDASRRGIGFPSVLAEVKRVFDAQPGRAAEAGRKLTAVIRQALAPIGGSELPAAGSLAKAAQHYRSRFDPANGGVGAAPKFPSSLPVRFLLRYHRRTGDGAVLDMAKLSLAKMAAGGMYDQAGGGFHRYATDEKWLVPHFEKMLYDNALLAVAYLEAYQATGEKEFERIVRETLRFLERDMASPEGAFYSATDADSPTPDGRREEGYFFTWTPRELEEVLGRDRGRIVARAYGVTESGNFEGRSILHLPESPLIPAAGAHPPGEKTGRTDADAMELLYRARCRRPPPLRDEKVITAWNGLAVSAFARAGLVLGDSRHVDRAEKAARFALSNLSRNGRLFRTFKDGTARYDAYLQDYAFLTAGLLDLYEATGDPEWITKAIALDAVLEEHFEDRSGGAFYMTADDHERLLVREKPFYDGAEPSGNSVATLNLLRLHGFTDREGYRKRAESALRCFGDVLRSDPYAVSEMLLAVDFHLDTPRQILIVAPPGRKDAADSLLSAFRRRFVPNRVFALVEQGDALEKNAAVVPLLGGKEAAGGRATAYVCENRVCGLPTSDPAEFSLLLRDGKNLLG
jgi:uncharacterized protein YyaL (SSP411 family)